MYDNEEEAKLPASFIGIVKNHTQNMLQALDRTVLAKKGDHLDPDVLENTPSRVANMIGEVLGGYAEDPNKLVKVFPSNTSEMIISKGIDFHSLCEHHMLPFYGHIHIGYIPNGKVLGVSKLARIALVFAKRMQIQERLTAQVADFLYETDARKKLTTPTEIIQDEVGKSFGRESVLKIDAAGVMVVVEAVHLCEVMRGVKMAHARMVTSAVRGSFKDNGATRAVFLSLIHNGDTI